MSLSVTVFGERSGVEPSQKLFPAFAVVTAGLQKFVIGIGRGGSTAGPVLAGALFAEGASLLAVSLTMGLGGLLAAAMIFLLPWAQRKAARTLD